LLSPDYGKTEDTSSVSRSSTPSPQGEGSGESYIEETGLLDDVSDNAKISKIKERSREKIKEVYKKQRERELRGQINDSTVLYLNEDKERTRKWFHDCDNLNVPLAGTQHGLIRSISYTDGIVNVKRSDTSYHWWRTAQSKNNVKTGSGKKQILDACYRNRKHIGK